MSTSARVLVGRDSELDAVERWVDGLGDGPSGLVISGDAGIGKTSVWTAATTAASERGIRVLVTRPVEAEFRLGYAGLGDLLGGAVEHILADLPEPQARALAAALDLGDADGTADPLLVGRAIGSALQALAGSGPIVVAIDDVQWLDQPSARGLAFAVRRLGTLPVGVVLSLRTGHDEPIDLVSALGDRSLELQLDGLSVGAMGRLLRTKVDPEMSRRRLLDIHARSAGNPFFGIELARAGEGGLPSSLRDLVRDRLDQVTPAGDAAIDLVAVLGPSRLSAFDDMAGLDRAVAAGILADQDGLIRFSHPLLAAAAYERMPPGRRLELHQRAAAASVTIEDRARHLALATTEPDEAVATALDAAARSARLRGAPETAVEFGAQARRLTPPGDTAGRACRAMDQVGDLYVAADEAAARTLVDEVLAGEPTGVILARGLFLRAMFDVDPRAAVARLEAAVAEPHDDDQLRARSLAQLAWQRGMWLGDVEPAIEEARRAVRAAEATADEETLVTALTTAGLLTAIEGLPEAPEYFHRALTITDRVPTATGDHPPAIAFAHERAWRGEYDAAEALMALQRARSTQRGEESQAMRLDIFGADFALRRGHWDEAERLLEEALANARDYWRIVALIRRGILRARRGEARALADAAEIAGSPVAAADPIIAAAAAFIAGSMELAGGQGHGAALRMASLPETSDRNPPRRAEFAVFIPETVAALVQADLIAQAEALTVQLERREAQLAPWSTAASALCRGLLALADGRTEEALELLRVAEEGFQTLGAPWELAQTRLAEGRAQRRIGHRLEAARAIEQAVAGFAGLGAEPARRRAVEELARARPRPRHDDSLTAAETRVARLVAVGSTNREVAARLFTTIATVEAHLTRIYAKAGVRSRSELTRKVSEGSLQLGSDAPDDGGPSTDPGGGGVRQR
jgi:DNA-binding CsgD family transcriptional regulator